jgi:NADH-quinone oxidoreductase subunit L
VDGFARVLEWIDLKIINGIVNGLGSFTRWSGLNLRYAQDGQVQTYALYLFAGVIILLAGAIMAVFTAIS